jgi:O-6-methylguanine DNA methyltransferase
MNNDFIELPVATSEGTFLAHYSEKGLAELDWPHQVKQTARAVVTRQIPTQVLRWHKLTTDGLKSVIAGRPAKELPPIDWAGKTEFQKSVWRVMLNIPTGKTKSYGEVAAAIKNPKAVRAVGTACGANPIPILVPCHRILAANHKLGGFGGGLDWKRKLLATEGIKF